MITPMIMTHDQHAFVVYDPRAAPRIRQPVYNLSKLIEDFFERSKGPNLDNIQVIVKKVQATKKPVAAV